jgi:PPK2 family polyphosphate:nucleotide phosphotransferase
MSNGDKDLTRDPHVVAEHEQKASSLQRAERITAPETLEPGWRPPEPEYPQYRARPGHPIRLADIDPNDTGQYKHKDDAQEELEKHRERLGDLQARLYAEHKQSLLIVLQAIDTGGKDGTIKSVFEGINPEGCQVWSFKVPSAEELDHDFLWRIHARTPGKGMIGIFNRSHYEEVLVVRVHKLVPEEVWRTRYGLINDFERLLTFNNTIVLKFFLYISRDEQKERLQSRLDHPDKNWKFSPLDIQERALWDDYMAAFEDAVNNCSTDYAPWYVIPANHKWYRDLLVARTIADTLEAMNPQYPPPAEGLDKVVIPD